MPQGLLCCCATVPLADRAPGGPRAVGGVVEGRALDRASPGREGARAGGRGPWLPAFGRSDWPGVAVVADGPAGRLRGRGGWGGAGRGAGPEPKAGIRVRRKPCVVPWPGSCATRAAAEAGYE